MSERINKDTKHDNKKTKGKERTRSGDRFKEGKIERGNKNCVTRGWGKRRIQLKYVGTYSPVPEHRLLVCSNIGVSPEGRRKRLSLFLQCSTPSLSGEEFRDWTREGEKK